MQLSPICYFSDQYYKDLQAQITILTSYYWQFSWSSGVESNSSKNVSQHQKCLQHCSLANLICYKSTHVHIKINLSKYRSQWILHVSEKEHLLCVECRQCCHKFQDFCNSHKHYFFANARMDGFNTSRILLYSERKYFCRSTKLRSFYWSVIAITF